MSESKDRKVEITKGTVKIVGGRKDLISVSETPDGMAFKFKGGINIVVIDDYMTNSVKKRIAGADLTFEDANLMVDLGNYRNPVLVDTT